MPSNWLEVVVSLSLSLALSLSLSFICPNACSWVCQIFGTSMPPALPPVATGGLAAAVVSSILSSPVTPPVVCQDLFVDRPDRICWISFVAGIFVGILLVQFVECCLLVKQFLRVNLRWQQGSSGNFLAIKNRVG